MPDLSLTILKANDTAVEGGSISLDFDGESITFGPTDDSGTYLASAPCGVILRHIFTIKSFEN